MTSSPRPTTAPQDTLVAATRDAVHAAGVRLMQRYNTQARPDSLDTLLHAIHANDAASLAGMRDALQAARPQAGWVEDEEGSGALPPGEWWVVDPTEGNINHIHGLPDWGVSATLVRDNRPVLTVIHQPLADVTWVAQQGQGAFRNGVPLRVSAKTDLRAAIFATGQARPGESAETHRRMGASITAMLGAVLVVRAMVPATFQLTQVAGGHIDGFWQHSQVRSGLAAGALLVQEAGGEVLGIDGQPWTLASPDFLASAPGLHEQTLQILRKVD